MNGLLADMDAFFALAAWLPALPPAWPLALTLALVLPPWRRRVLALARWAALPALLIAMTAPEAQLRMPGLMLGSSLLQLDETGRWLLAAVALLWLAGGWLAADWLRAPRRAVPFLLAMTGALWLPLTGDLPSALAASVLAAYPLYALLGGGSGPRVLVVSVVIADLLILEVLLLLAKDAAGLDFMSLRAPLSEAHERGVLLALLLIGFGAKAGVTGLCYWLTPVLAEARARYLGPVVAFTLVAGVLPWLRLLPLDEVQWPAVAALLPGLALMGCAWAAVAGLLQATPRAVTAYALAGVTTLWLGLLGLRLDAPGEVMAMTATFPAMLALSGVGMAALLLDRDAANGRRGIVTVVAVLLIAVAVLGAALLTLAASDAAPWPIAGSVLCVGLLLGASITAGASTDARAGRDRESPVGIGLVVAGFVMATLAFPSPSGELPPPVAWFGHQAIAFSVALLAGFVVGLGAFRVLARLPRVPAGDLVALMEPAALGLVEAWQRLGAVAGRWRDTLYDGVARARRWAESQDSLSRIEARLRRWSTATLLLVVAGAAAALLV